MSLAQARFMCPSISRPSNLWTPPEIRRSYTWLARNPPHNNGPSDWIVASRLLPRGREVGLWSVMWYVLSVASLLDRQQPSQKAKRLLRKIGGAPDVVL